MSEPTAVLIRLGRLEGDLQVHAASDEKSFKDVREWLIAIDDRLRTIERLVWIAVGGTTAFGSIVVYFASSVNKLLVK